MPTNPVTSLQDIQKHISIVGDVNIKSPFVYQATRGMVGVVNMVKMAVAETFIDGLEVPDSLLRSLFDTYMPISFRYFPSLLAPYEWVLKETDRLAQGLGDLMKIQYGLPQGMLNTMLGNWKLIYCKYSIGLLEKGASNLEQSQMHMIIDDVIEKLDIKDVDNILDF